jgi:hypothetical protein
MRCGCTVPDLPRAYDRCEVEAGVVNPPLFCSDPQDIGSPFAASGKVGF